MSPSAILEKLDELIKDGTRSEQPSDYEEWSRRVIYFLRKAFDLQTASEFEELHSADERWWIGRGRQIGMLEGLAAWNSDSVTRSPSVAAGSPLQVLTPKQVC